jgi:hypothetical protein
MRPTIDRGTSVGLDLKFSILAAIDKRSHARFVARRAMADIDLCQRYSTNLALSADCSFRSQASIIERALDSASSRVPKIVFSSGNPPAGSIATRHCSRAIPILIT